MQISLTRPGYNRHLLCTLVVLAGMVGIMSGAGSAFSEGLGPCEPGLVEHWRHRLPIVPAAAHRPVQTAVGPVLIEWLGHSSFLLTSPGGLRLLTDPNAFHPLRMAPDAVTVSNWHTTHSVVGQVPGTPRILWGLNPDGGWNQVALTLGDVSLFNLPSYASRSEPENSPIQNSIFVFRTHGLCIVHLGNLRHLLTLQQLKRIGKPDVLMIPVDGQWTLAYDDVLTVITQLQPLLVIPMHIDFSADAEVFVQYTAGRYPVRRLSRRTLPLSRSLLPASTEIVVFNDS